MGISTHNSIFLFKVRYFSTGVQEEAVDEAPYFLDVSILISKEYIPQCCFKEVFFNIFSFLAWRPFRICLYYFFERFTLKEILLIFMRKILLNIRKKICFLFPFCLTCCCWWLESAKELYFKNISSWEWSARQPFSEKSLKEMTLSIF